MVSSEVESEIFECRAAGFPPPVDVTYKARVEGEMMMLTDNMDGVEIFTENDETVGVLRIRGNFQSVECSVSNSDRVMMNESNFKRLAPINGKN